MGLNEEEANL